MAGWLAIFAEFEREILRSELGLAWPMPRNDWAKHEIEPDSL
jgi:hypothetical protein